MSSGIYYKLSLKSRQKPPKCIDVKYSDCDLNQLNFLLNASVKNSKSVKSQNYAAPILNLLDKIIPNDYFGTTFHRKLFYQIVKKIATQSVYECIFASDVIQGYNYNLIPWMDSIKIEQQRRCLLKRSNIFLLENIVKPLISFYYKPIRTMNGHQIEFVSRQKWSSYEHQVYKRFKSMQYMTEVDEVSTLHRPRGLLKIIPKNKYDVNSFRPIISVFSDRNKHFYKCITSKVYKAAREMRSYPSLYNCWSSFVQKIGQKRLFGAKLDIRDAYGSVNVKTLCGLIQDLTKEQLSDTMKQFVIDHVSNQFVTFKKKVYRWNHGLLQGDRLSACLCELYMSYLDELHLQKFGEEAFMHRTVDDYFFCSTKAHEVDEFVNTINHVHQVNDNKTQIYTNSEMIVYCGKVFNLSTKEVGACYNFSDKYEIRLKFKLWNANIAMSIRDFVARRLSFSSCNNSFTKLELNTVFNSTWRVLKNYFDGMIYVAYRFDAAVMAIRNSTNDLDFIWTVLNKVINEYASKVCRKILKCSGNNDDMSVTFRLLKKLGFKAFVLMFKRRNEIYKHLIAKIKSVRKLGMHIKGVDCTYFEQLPACFQHLKINRKMCI